MNYKSFFDLESILTGVSGFFSAYGSFGIADGGNSVTENISETPNGYFADYGKFTAESEFTEFENGVYLRKDFFTAKEELVLNRYTSRFVLEGGEYEVYTQYSSWQHESMGGWQPLITTVEASNLGIRTTEGAAPMVVLKNKANGKMFVFHILPNAHWKIRVTKCPLESKNDLVLVEAGINDKGLALKCETGEKIEMPQILFYEAQNSLDFDAFKLHNVYNKLYPRRSLPIIYNTWLLDFDNVDVDNILRQVDTAAELGIEAFLIDAGWFGTEGPWWQNIGNWVENRNSGFFGRLKEVSDYIREKGMVFGLWLEPERALVTAESYKAHPEYFKRGHWMNSFLDFANPDALKHITDTVCSLIEEYNIGYIKFDFNSPLAFDESGNGFYRYFKGAEKFVRTLREKHPDLYLTNCASGGARMDMYNQTLYDSIWISDNQSPVESLRIFKETALRLSPSNMEKYDVRRFSAGFPNVEGGKPKTLALSCNNATWTDVVAVSSRYTHAFLTGGPMGFSANIADYPEDEKAALKTLIANYKEEREFYKNATLRILHDGGNITALQYSDEKLKRNIIQIFTTFVCQKYVTIYPVLNSNQNYIYNGETVSGETLMKNGIKVNATDNDCTIIEITE